MSGGGGKGQAPAGTRYNRAAVDRAIKGSRQRIGGREGKLIHALLRGRQREDQ